MIQVVHRKFDTVLPRTKQMVNALIMITCLILLIDTDKLKCFTHIVSLINDSTKAQSPAGLFVSYHVYSVFIIVDSRSAF